MATMSGMSNEQLARTQEELFASAGVRMMPRTVSLFAEVIVGDEIEELFQMLEVCSVDEDTA